MIKNIIKIKERKPNKLTTIFISVILFTIILTVILIYITYGFNLYKERELQVYREVKKIGNILETKKEQKKFTEKNDEFNLYVSRHCPVRELNIAAECLKALSKFELGDNSIKDKIKFKIYYHTFWRFRFLNERSCHKEMPFIKYLWGISTS